MEHFETIFRPGRPSGPTRHAAPPGPGIHLARGCGALYGELAELTGETMTGAVTVSLRERLERERRERDIEVPCPGAGRHRATQRQAAARRAVGRRSW